MYTFEKMTLIKKFFSQAEYVPKYALFLNMNNSLHCWLLSEVSTDSDTLESQNFESFKLFCAFLRKKVHLFFSKKITAAHGPATFFSN